MMPFLTRAELAELINLSREAWGEEPEPAQRKLLQKLQLLYATEMQQQQLEDAEAKAKSSTVISLDDYSRLHGMN